MSLWKHLRNWKANLRLCKIRTAFSVSCLGYVLYFSISFVFFSEWYLSIFSFCFIFCWASLLVMCVSVFVFVKYFTQHKIKYDWWKRTNVKHQCIHDMFSLLFSEFWLTTMSLYWLGQTLQQFTLFVIIHVDELFVFCLFFHLFRWFEVCCRGAWTGEKPTTGADFDPWETMWRSRGPSATSGSHWITTGTPKLFGLHILGTIIRCVSNYTACQLTFC